MLGFVPKRSPAAGVGIGIRAAGRSPQPSALSRARLCGEAGRPAPWGPGRRGCERHPGAV